MEKKQFWIFAWLVFFIQCVPAGAFLYPAAFTSLGYSSGQIGVLMSILYAAATLGRPFGGVFSERLGIKRTIILGTTGGCLGGLLLMADCSFSLVLIGRCLVGFFFGCSMVAVTAYQSMAIPPEKRGRLFALLGLAYIFPQFLLVPMSEFLLKHSMMKSFLGQISAMLFCAVFFSLPLVPLVQKNRRKQSGVQWGTWNDLFHDSGIRALVLTIFVYCIFHAAGLQYVPTMAMSRGLTGSLFTVSGAVMCIVLRGLFGSVMVRYNRKALFCLTSAIQAVGVFCATMSYSQTALIISGLIFGLGMGYAYPTMLALIPDVVPVRLVPKGSAAAMFANDLGFIITPLLIGSVDASLSLGHIVQIITGCFLLFVPLSYRFLWGAPHMLPEVRL